MKARLLLERAVYPPHVLRLLFEAFDEAWREVATDVSARPKSIEAARLSLATIVLSLANKHPIQRDSISAEAIEAFRLKHSVLRMDQRSADGVPPGQ